MIRVDDVQRRIAATSGRCARRVVATSNRSPFKEGSERSKSGTFVRIDPRPYAPPTIARWLIARASAAEQARRSREKRAPRLDRRLGDLARRIRHAPPRLDASNADVRQPIAAVADGETQSSDFHRAPLADRRAACVARCSPSAIEPRPTKAATSVVPRDPVYVYFQPDEQTSSALCGTRGKGERAKSAKSVRVGLATDKAYPYTATMNFITPGDPATAHNQLLDRGPNQNRIFTGLVVRGGVQLEGVPTSRPY